MNKRQGSYSLPNNVKMDKITYLIGAGASYGSIPTVKEFADKINEIITRLQRMIDISDPTKLRGYPESISRLNKGDIKPYSIALNDLIFLWEGCRNHMSVDTFARMLYLTSNHGKGKERYRICKSAIVLFFELHRFFATNFDKRYDAFLASILNENSPRFPENINVISWNYDWEFERAFKKYCPELVDIHDVYKELNVVHKNSKTSQSFNGKFGILKINGTSGFYEGTENELNLGLNHPDLISKNVDNFYEIQPLLQNYVHYTHEQKYEPSISFSWENSVGACDIQNEIQDLLHGTKTLVIIGYSFPYFNRKMDRKILDSITNSVDIHIQDPNANSLIENVRNLRTGPYGQTIKAITSTDQFYMPHNL